MYCRGAVGASYLKSPTHNHFYCENITQGGQDGGPAVRVVRVVGVVGWSWWSSEGPSIGLFSASIQVILMRHSSGNWFAIDNFEVLESAGSAGDTEHPLPCYMKHDQ